MRNRVTRHANLIPADTNVVIALQNRSLGRRGWNSQRSPLHHYADCTSATFPLENQKFELPQRTRTTFITAFNRDNSFLATCHGDHHTHILDVKTKKLVKSLTGHERSPWCVTFHPGSQEIIATGSLNGEVRVWDLRGNGSESWTLEYENVEQVAIASLSFHPYDHVLAIAGGNEIYFWDWSLPRPFASVKTSSKDERVRLVRFDPWGHSIITGVGNIESELEDLDPVTLASRLSPWTRHSSGTRLSPQSHERLITLNEPTIPNSNDIVDVSEAPPYMVPMDLLLDTSSEEESNRLHQMRRDISETHQRILHARVSVNEEIRQQYSRLQILRQERHRLEMRLRELQNSANEVRNSTPTLQDLRSPQSEENTTIGAPYATSIENSYNSHLASLNNTVRSVRVTQARHQSVHGNNSHPGGARQRLHRRWRDHVLRNRRNAISDEGFIVASEREPEARVLNPESTDRRGSSDISAEIRARHDFPMGPITNITSTFITPAGSTGPPFEIRRVERARPLDRVTNYTTPRIAPYVLLPPLNNYETQTSLLAPSTARYLNSNSNRRDSSSITRPQHHHRSFSTATSPAFLTAPISSYLSLLHQTSRSMAAEMQNDQSDAMEISVPDVQTSVSLGRSGEHTSDSENADVDVTGHVQERSATDIYPEYDSHWRNNASNMSSNGTQSFSQADPVVDDNSVDLGTDMTSEHESLRMAQRETLRRPINLIPAENAWREVTELFEPTDEAADVRRRDRSDASPLVTQPNPFYESTDFHNVRSSPSDPLLRDCLLSSSHLPNTSRHHSNSYQVFTSETSSRSHSGTPPSTSDQSSSTGAVINTSDNTNLEQSAADNSSLSAAQTLSAAVNSLIEATDSLNEAADDLLRDTANSAANLLSDPDTSSSDGSNSPELIAAPEQTADPNRPWMNSLTMETLINRIPQSSQTRPRTGLAPVVHRRSRPRTSEGNLFSRRRAASHRHSRSPSELESRSDGERNNHHREISSRNRAYWDQVFALPARLRANSRGLVGSARQHPRLNRSRRSINMRRSNINRIISEVYAENHGHRAVLLNLDNSTYRLQYWDFTKVKLPEISRNDINVLVTHCKIYNDGSVDISRDGQILAAFVPNMGDRSSRNSHRMDVAVFSLDPSNLGQMLFRKGYEPNAVCLSISPLSNYICVGIKNRHFMLGESRPVSFLMGHILELPGENSSPMPVIAHINHPADSHTRIVSINTVAWSPEVGGGLVYGTNNGDVRMCVPMPKKRSTS